MKKVLLLCLLSLAVFACKKSDGVNENQIQLDKYQLTITQFESAKLSIANSADYSSTAPFQWQSSDSTIAKVDQNGGVLAIAPGETEIYVAVAGIRSSLSQPCVVTVKGFNAQGIAITFPADSLSLSVGEVVNGATFAFDPANTSNQKVDIVRSDSIGVKFANIEIVEEAKLNTPGQLKVTALSYGVVKFYLTSLVAKADDPKKFDTVKSNTITLNIGGVAITGFDWAKLKGQAQIPTTVKSGAQYRDTIVALITPRDAVLKNLTWKSANPAVLEVKAISDTSAMLTGFVKHDASAQTVRILAATEDGRVLTRDITVNPADAPLPEELKTPTKINFAKDTIDVTMSELLAGVDILPRMTIAPGNTPLYANFYKDGVESVTATATESKATATFPVAINKQAGDPNGKVTSIIVHSSAADIWAQASAKGIAKIVIAADTMQRNVTPQSATTSLFATIYVRVVQSEMPATLAVLKATYTYADQKYTVNAYLTPFETPKSAFTTVKAEVWREKGTVISPEETLEADAKVEAIAPITLTESNNAFKGSFAPFTDLTKLKGYFVKYEVTSGTTKNYFDRNIVVDNGVALAPPRK